MGSIRGKAHILPDNAHATVSISAGQAHIISSGVVMDIAAFKVSHSVIPDIDATTLRAVRARSSSILERYTWVRFAGKLTSCQTMHMQRSAFQRGNGTLHAWVRFGAKLTPPCHDTPPTVSIPMGRWITVQGRFKMQTPTPEFCAHTRSTHFQFSGASTLKGCCYGYCSLQS